METIQELSERIDGLVMSIKKPDLKDKEFISHKYILVSLHANIERMKLEKLMETKSNKISFTKQYNLYKTIEGKMSKKAHEMTTEEMYAVILECQKLISKNV